MGKLAAGNTLHISAELEELNTGLVVWDSVYDGRTDDTNLFALQSTIAAAVSDSLRVVMLARERRALDGAHSEGFGLRIMNPPL